MHFAVKYQKLTGTKEHVIVKKFMVNIEKIDRLRILRQENFTNAKTYIV